MKIYTVAEALELEDKTPLSSIKGTLINVWPAKPFTIKKGPRKGEKGSVQNLTLQDDTGEIKMKNWGSPLPNSDRGEEFLFESHKGTKGLKGLSVVIDTYDDSKVISMDENAKIKGPDGELASSSKPKTREEATAVKALRDPFEVARQAKEGVRLSMRMAYELAQELTEEHAKACGEGVSAEQIGQWGASINYHLRDKCVFAALVEKKEAPESTPAPKPRKASGRSGHDAEPSAEDIRNAKPKMTNADEDEIPF